MPDPITTSETRGYEPQRFNLSAINWFVVCFFASLILFFIGLYFLQNSLLHDVRSQYPDPSPIARQIPAPEPLLQPSPAHPTNDWQDRRILHDAQEHQLNSYGSLPDDPGFVHIPIDRAITLLLEHPRPAPATQPELRP